MLHNERGSLVIIHIQRRVGNSHSPNPYQACRFTHRDLVLQHQIFGKKRLHDCNIETFEGKAVTSIEEVIGKLKAPPSYHGKERGIAKRNGKSESQNWDRPPVIN